MGSALRSQVFTASGTFNVPSNVTAVFITACGSGTGGNGYQAGGGNPNAGGGGAAEFCMGRLIPVTAGGTLAITVSAGGAGATGNNTIAAAGATTFGGFSMLGGKASRSGSSNGADGGGVGGGLSDTSEIGKRESISAWGGAPGPQHNASGGPNGTAQQITCAGQKGGAGNSGTGGSALVWPSGGNGSDAGSTQNGTDATGWGAGGGGCGQTSVDTVGGNGMSGVVIVHWFG